MTKRRLLLVAVGGAAGATLRWAVSTLDVTSAFPWPTLLVNVLGAGLLGWLIATKPAPDRLALIGAGFCGGLTTFSTLSVEVAELLRDDAAVTGWLYLLLSVFLGSVTFLVGRLAGQTVEGTVA